MSTDNFHLLEPQGRLTPNKILLLVFGTVIVLTLIVVIISSRKGIEKWEPTTPQGVVQAYLTALINGDTDKAFVHLDPESKCDLQDLDRSYIAERIRISLSKSQIVGDRASITVTAEVPTGDPFSNFMTESHTLRLAQTEGNWKLIGVPWPMYDCEVKVK